MASKLSISNKVIIRRPIDEVFLYVADVRNDSYWRKEVIDVKYTTPDPKELNSQFLEHIYLWGMSMKNWMVVIDYEHNRTMSYESFKGQSVVFVTRIVQEVAEGTELSWHVDIELGQAFIIRMIGHLAKGWSKRRLQRNMQLLKRMLE